MGMFRKLFRPGAGQTVQRFTSAFVNGSASYPGDLCMWDTTAPTDQGASGVLEGQTLTDFDFVYVKTPTALTQGFQAGILRGPNIHDMDTTTNIADDALAIVQTHGVCATCWVDDTDVAALALAVTGATTGELTTVLTGDVATDVNGTDAILGNGGSIVGGVLTADRAVTRATTSEQYAAVFIRCDY